MLRFFLKVDKALKYLLGLCFSDEKIEVYVAGLGVNLVEFGHLEVELLSPLGLLSLHGDTIHSFPSTNKWCIR